MTIPPLRPKNIACVTGDYGTGKSTLMKAWVQSLGRGVFWAAPPRLGAPCDYSDIAVVVRSRLEMERALTKVPYVVWPSPPSSAGMERIRADFNDFCEVSMMLRECAWVGDELQRILGDSKRLADAPPAFQDIVELGHKDPGNLAKLYGAHRLAQIPLTLGAGAYRVSTRPFPGDEDALLPFFGKEGVARMKRFQVGDFAFWSADAGAVLPCRLNLGKSSPGGGSAQQEGKGAP